MSTALQGRFLPTRPPDHPIHHRSYPWGLDSATTSSRGKSAIYPSLPKAQTPLSCTHWKYLLYFPVLTSVWCKVSLWWIFCEGKREEKETPGRASWVSQSTKAFLSSLPWSLQSSWEAEMIENKSKLTVRTSACWLLHPLHWADRPGDRCLHPDTGL